MGIIYFFIANIVVLFCAIIIADRLKIKSLADRILAAFISGISQIILTELFLGLVLKRLFPLELVLLNIFILAVIFKVCKVSIKEYIRLKDFIIKIYCDFKSSFQYKNPLIMVLGVVGLGLLGYVFFFGLRFPVRGYDALAYHLPQVIFWWKSGAISLLPGSYPDAWVWGNVYPINAELLALWSVIFLKSDKIISLVQIFFVFAGATGIYSLARKMQIGVRNSIIAGLIFITTPIVIVQAGTSYVDVTFGAAVIIAINYLLAYFKSLSKKDILLMSVALGILLGVKSSGIAYAGVIALAAIIVMLAKQKFNFSKLAGLILLMLLPMLLLGSFSYIRNLVAYQNPLYPFQLKVMGIEVFKGVGTVEDVIMTANTPLEYRSISNIMRVARTWLEETEYYTYDAAKSGFGPFWLILGIPSAILVLITAIKEKKKPILVVFLIFSILFAIQPSNWWTRYTIFIIALGALPVAYLLEYSGPAITKAITVTGIIITIFTAINILVYIPASAGGESAFLKDYDWVKQVGPGTKIGVASTKFMYPLFGKKFDNNVMVVETGTKDEFIKDILAKDCQYVVTMKDYKEHYKWAESFPQNLSKSFESDFEVVYKVQK